MSITKLPVKSISKIAPRIFVDRITKYMPLDENMDNVDWEACRKSYSRLYSHLPAKKDVIFTRVTLRGVECFMAEPLAPLEDNTIIYIHGGGFVTGNAFCNKNYLSALALASNCRIYSVDYSLAPEHPFPKGFEDCCDVFEEVAELHPGSKITLTGESSGGNLSLALGHKYKNTGRIACILAHSPTVDFTGNVSHCNNNDTIVRKGCVIPLRKMYLNGADPQNPFISPVLGDFSNYPPTFLTCDFDETLFEDALAIHYKLESTGIPVELTIMIDSFHAFGISGTSTPESTKILQRSISFMNRFK